MGEGRDTLQERIKKLEVGECYWRDKEHERADELLRMKLLCAKQTKTVKKLTAERDRLHTIINKFESEIIVKELQT